MVKGWLREWLKRVKWWIGRDVKWRIERGAEERDRTARPEKRVLGNSVRLIGGGR